MLQIQSTQMQAVSAQMHAQMDLVSTRMQAVSETLAKHDVLLYGVFAMFLILGLGIGFLSQFMKTQKLYVAAAEEDI